MTTFILKRIGAGIVLLVAITMPHVHAAVLLQRTSPATSWATRPPTSRSRPRRASWASTNPLCIRFVDWLRRHAVGTSELRGSVPSPSSNALATRLPVTLTLVIVAMSLVAIIAAPSSARRQPSRAAGSTAWFRSWRCHRQRHPGLHHRRSSWSGSSPSNSGWFPAVSKIAPGAGPEAWVASMTLPIIAIVINYVASSAQQIRSAVLDQYRRDYVRTLRSRGIPEREILFKHVLRSARPAGLTDHLTAVHRPAGRCRHHRADLRPTGHRPARDQCDRARRHPDRHGRRARDGHDRHHRQPPRRSRERRFEPEGACLMSDPRSGRQGHRAHRPVRWRARASVAAAYLRNPLGVAALVILAIMALAIAVFGPVLAPYDPNFAETHQRTLAPPSREHLLGTDSAGRDVLSRLFFGARLTLLSAAGGAGVAIVIGLPAGLIAGYYSGPFDSSASWATNLLMACLASSCCSRCVRWSDRRCGSP